MAPQQILPEIQPTWFKDPAVRFQIECNRSSSEHQICVVCEQQFELREARVIACDRNGDAYGDICTTCIERQRHQIFRAFEASSLSTQVRKVS